MTVRQSVLAFAVSSLLAAPAWAQDSVAAASKPAAVEIFVGYGGEAQLGDVNRFVSESRWTSNPRVGVYWNLTDRVGLVFNVPTLGVANSQATGTQVNYAFLVGPRLRFRQQQRVMPFAQVQFGAEHGWASLDGRSIPLSAGARETAFLASLAGGIDVGFGRRFAWRAIQVEERSLFGTIEEGHRMSFSSGVVFQFGGHK
jgi:hypothetical protein